MGFVAGWADCEEEVDRVGLRKPAGGSEQVGRQSGSAASPVASIQPVIFRRGSKHQTYLRRDHDDRMHHHSGCWFSSVGG